MYKYKILTSFILFLIFRPLHGVVILIHGTFASNEIWHRPGGDFYNELEKQANLINQNLIPFMWSGENNYQARLKAAECLTKIILSYPLNEIFILIAHSHGGNIINLTSQLLFDPLEELMSNYTQEQLYAEITELINQNYETICLGKTKSIFDIEKEKGKYFEEISLFIDTYKNIRKGRTKTLQYKNAFEKKYLIDAAYLLGAPIDENIYSPNMSIIKTLYNLYSSNDFIQPVLGYYHQSLTNYERIINLQITLKGKSPSHSNLHDPAIARWLLSIPERIEPSINKINFEKDNLELIRKLQSSEKPDMNMQKQTKLRKYHSVLSNE